MRAVPRGCARPPTGWGRRSSRSSDTVVLPAALSGVMASIILAMSRAIGETMVVVLAGGTGGRSFTLDPLESGPDDDRAIIVQIGQGRHAPGLDPVPVLFVVGLVLFLMTSRSTSSASGSSAAYREAY